jgi:hypothetical protein
MNVFELCAPREVPSKCLCSWDSALLRGGFFGGQGFPLATNKSLHGHPSHLGLTVYIANAFRVASLPFHSPPVSPLRTPGAWTGTFLYLQSHRDQRHGYSFTDLTSSLMVRLVGSIHSYRSLCRKRCSRPHFRLCLSRCSS